MNQFYKYTDDDLKAELLRRERQRALDADPARAKFVQALVSIHEMPNENTIRDLVVASWVFFRNHSWSEMDDLIDSVFGERPNPPTVG